MAVPAVKGYMPLCVTPRSNVCDEQGVGQWPMWKRFDSVKAIVDQYIDEPYRDFLALPYHEIDKLKAEELFYWYTPRRDTAFMRMSRTGDDLDYYKGILADTMERYQSAIKKLQSEGKAEEANFLQLSLKYAGESEDNIYCGDGRVVATVWGMRQRPSNNMGESKLVTELLPEVEIHTVRFELGSLGSTTKTTALKKSHGSRIYAHQVPPVSPKDGYECIGWDCDPIGAEVTDDLLFSAQYRELPKEETPTPQKEEKPSDEKPKDNNVPLKHQVRFLSPDNLVIKELSIEHGKQIMPGDVPQLPAVDGVLCPSWDGDPLNDTINQDCDYTALMPKKAEVPTHTIRFLAPDGHVISQSQVEHGTTISQAQIPPLPVLDGMICPAWDSNPLGMVVNADHDFVARQPLSVVEGKIEETDGTDRMHIARFLNPDGSEMKRIQVEHGNRISPDQIPALPVVDGASYTGWSPNPAKKVIKHDTDFTPRNRRSWRWVWTWGDRAGSGFWRWILRILLFLLLVLLVLYIMYLSNPCSK